jgi:hypothetical protein
MLLGSGIVGDIAARREFAADAAWRTSWPTRMFERVPIRFE